MPTVAELYELLNKIRYDTTSIQMRVTDCMKILGELSISDKPQVLCPKCGAPFRGPRLLEEHLYISHDGPVPQLWEQIDARALDPVEP